MEVLLSSHDSCWLVKHSVGQTINRMSWFTQDLRIGGQMIGSWTDFGSAGLETVLRHRLTARPVRALKAARCFLCDPAAGAASGQRLSWMEESSSLIRPTCHPSPRQYVPSATTVLTCTVHVQTHTDTLDVLQTDCGHPVGTRVTEQIPQLRQSYSFPFTSRPCASSSSSFVF